MLKHKLEIHGMPNSFNMTPIVDIVFLLIIFFMLVCQFIVAENFQVNVPENISNAQRANDSKELVTTVTVTKDNSNRIIYAVGSEKVKGEDFKTISEKISQSINSQINLTKQAKKIVSLRINKDISYKYSQTALQGISLSSATDLKIAVIDN